MKSSGIGGQAVIEGVMMKNKEKYAVSVRKPDNEIVVDTNEYISLGTRYPVLALPIIRGVVTFFESMVIGIKTLTFSSSFYEEDTKESVKDKTTKKSKVKENIMMAATVACSVLLAIGIFMLLPYFVSTCLVEVIDSSVVLTLIEGVLRLVLFVGYVLIISCMKDIRRVFMYHGAEHKSINCIEHGLELTVENVRKQSKQHKRCGTSFLLIVMVLSIIFFMFIRVDAAWLRVVLRLVLIPVIAGVSYEFIKLAGANDTPLMNLLCKPGLALQGLTTREPDDSMIEVAIASVEAVFDWKAYLAECENEKKSSRDRKRRKVTGNTEVTAAESEIAAAKAEEKNSATAVDSETVTEKTEEKTDKTAVAKAKQENKKTGKQTKRNVDALVAATVGKKETVKREESTTASIEEKETVKQAEPVAAPAEEKETAKKEAVKPAEPVAKRDEKKSSVKTNEPMASYKIIGEEPEDDDILNALDKFFVQKHDKDDDGLE